MDQEWEERTTTNLSWLRQAFEHARAANSRGVMIVWQANPSFEQPAEQRTGFNPLLRALEEQTIAFGKPVVLVHGDTHYFRIDKPMGPRLGGTVPVSIPNFTRVETFGTPNVHWLHVTVDYGDPHLFTIRPRIVP